MGEGCVSAEKEKNYSVAQSQSHHDVLPSWNLSNPLLPEWLKVIGNAVATSVSVKTKIPEYIHFVAFQKENEQDFAVIAKLHTPRNVWFLCNGWMDFLDRICVQLNVSIV